MRPATQNQWSIKKPFPKNAHSGRPGVILGNGKHLPDDLKRIPPNSVLFCVNLRPLQLCKPDYIVFMDEPCNEGAIKSGVPRISNLPHWSDFVVPLTHWDGGCSSSLATWSALYMDCNPVLLAGMGLYRENPTHFDGFHNARLHKRSLEKHIKCWMPAFDRCPHPERIKAMSGPLVDVFGKYVRFVGN